MKGKTNDMIIAYRSSLTDAQVKEALRKKKPLLCRLGWHTIGRYKFLWMPIELYSGAVCKRCGKVR